MPKVKVSSDRSGIDTKIGRVSGREKEHEVFIAGPLKQLADSIKRQRKAVKDKAIKDSIEGTERGRR